MRKTTEEVILWARYYNRALAFCVKVLTSPPAIEGEQREAMLVSFAQDFGEIFDTPPEDVLKHLEERLQNTAGASHTATPTSSDESVSTN
jgi:hypothetical protein